MGWPLKARRSLFLDWPWLCDESSPHRRALHIPVQILAGKFKMELLPIEDSAGKDFKQVWTNLCYRECFCKTISYVAGASEEGPVGPRRSELE